MRLWSLHPSYLDRAGLGGCWREALLAQAVLAGETSGYRSHPQLSRFRAAPYPLAAVGAYLAGVWAEADARGYSYDRSKIRRITDDRLKVTTGQLTYEREHLRAKLITRSPSVVTSGAWLTESNRSHPLFQVIPGTIESWERIST